MGSADRFSELKQILANRKAAIDLQVQEQAQIDTLVADAQSQAEQERVEYGAAQKSIGFKEGTEQVGKPGDKVFTQEEADARAEELVAPVRADNEGLRSQLAAQNTQIQGLQTVVSELQKQSGMTAVLVARAEAKVKADVVKKFKDAQVDNDALMADLEKESVFAEPEAPAVDPAAPSEDAPAEGEAKGLRKKR